MAGKGCTCLIEFSCVLLEDTSLLGKQVELFVLLQHPRYTVDESKYGYDGEDGLHTPAVEK